MQDFTHLHVHSNYSFCRGSNSIDDICTYIKKSGMKRVALTDVNGLYGLGWFICKAQENGITPLIGAEILKNDDRCVVLVKSLTGYSVLCDLLTRLHCDENFDFIQFLKSNHKDLFVISNSPKVLRKLSTSDCKVYAELVPHLNREEILTLCHNLNIPPVATGDVYFINKEDWKIHQMLRAIDLNTSLSRIPQKELASRQAHFLETQYFVDQFPDCPQAITNTNIIAQECQFDLGFGHLIFASFKGPNGEEANAFLEKEAIKGASQRYGHITREIMNRLDYELDIISEKGFAPYFLVVADIVRQSPRTCGRGSGAASLVSYCLYITHVDPIRHNLFFDRFLNPGRVDPPDIDVDFPWDERDDVLNYIFKKYGAQSTAMIANHNGFRARAAVREVAKVYGLSDTEISTVTKKLSSHWGAGSISVMIDKHPVFKDVKLEDPWPEIIEFAEQLHGFPRHLSVHCGGVVIAPDGLNRYVPCQMAKKQLNLTGIITENSNNNDIELPESIRVIQWEKEQAEDLGLVKMDILGNRSLAVIRDVLKAVKKNYSVKIDYAHWNPLNDEKTIQMIANGDTIGVFYVESPAMRLLQKKTRVGDYEHLVIHSSIIRPAANTYINENMSHYIRYSIMFLMRLLA